MTSTIEGTVTDTDGTPLEGVVVRVVETTGGLLKGGDTTDGTGGYSVSGLYSDTYDVTAAKIGYVTDVVADVSVGSSETRTVDFSLSEFEPKVIGETPSETGIGVHAPASATSGEPIGVLGEVESTEGYGLCTPDDARIDGTVESVGDWIVETSDGMGGAGNVVQGSGPHTFASSPLGETIAGGESNTTDGLWATIGGGAYNEATSNEATVAGGYQNVGGDGGATVGGGRYNEAKGYMSTIPGGRDNMATGDYSLAAGREASADHDGAVVVGDSTTTAVSSSTQDEVLFQAGGGFTVQAPSIDLQGQLFSSDGPLHLTGSDLVMSPGPPLGSGYDLQLDNGQVVIASSSARYKTDVRPLGERAELVLDLEPRTFEYVDRAGETELGLIAEEVDTVLPELVVRDEDGRPDAVKYDRIGACLVPEVRKNRDRLDELEQGHEETASGPRSRLTELEAENRELRAELAETRSTIEAREERIEALEGRTEDLSGRLAALESQNGDSAANSAD